MEGIDATYMMNETQHHAETDEVVVEIRDGEFEHERCVEEVGDGE